jgi:acid stress-induced BolA-like protein IbaG/YrbA
MTSTQVKALSSALRKKFAGKVQAERINGRGRYRFAVVSPRFNRMAHLKRQDAIWKVVDAILPREAILDISLILAYAPKELSGVKQNRRQPAA